MDRTKYRWHDLNNPYEYRNNNLRRLGFKSYAGYLRSALWKDIRARVFARDHQQCGHCGREATSVHHRAYDPKTLTGECIHALSAVCRKCHQRIEQPRNLRRPRWDRLHDSSAAVLKKSQRRKHRVLYEPPVWEANMPRLVKKDVGD
jgi:hypothetical protein